MVRRRYISDTRKKELKEERAKQREIDKKQKIVLEEEAKKPYTVNVLIDNISYTAKGNTMAEALSLIKPKIKRNKATITVLKDELKSEIFLYPILVRRMLVNKMYRNILDSRLNKLMK